MNKLILIIILFLSAHHAYAGIAEFKQAIAKDNIDYTEVKNALKDTTPLSLNNSLSNENYLACLADQYSKSHKNPFSDKAQSKKNKLINIAIYLRYKGAKWSQTLSDMVEYNVLKCWGRNVGAPFFLEGPLMGCAGSFKNKNIPEAITDINDLVERIKNHNRYIEEKTPNHLTRPQIAALPQDLPELYDEESVPQQSPQSPQPRPIHITPQPTPTSTTPAAPKPVQPAPEKKKYPLDFCDDPEGLLKYYQQTRDPLFSSFRFDSKVEPYTDLNILQCASPKMINKLADRGFLQQFPGIELKNVKKITADVKSALNKLYLNYEETDNPAFGKPTINRAFDNKQLFEALTHLMHEYLVAPIEVEAWCATCETTRNLVHTVIHSKPEFVQYLFKKGSDHKKARIEVDKDLQILAEQAGIRVIQDRNRFYIEPKIELEPQDQLQVKITNLKESLVTLKKKLQKLTKKLINLKNALTVK